MQATYDEFALAFPDVDVCDLEEFFLRQNLSDEDQGFLMAQALENATSKEWRVALTWAMETYGYGVL